MSDKINKMWEGYYDENIPGESDEPRYGEVTPSWYRERIAEVLKKTDNMDDLSKIKDFVTDLRQRRIDKEWADEERERERDRDEDRYDGIDPEPSHRRETVQDRYGYPGDQ